MSIKQDKNAMWYHSMNNRMQSMRKQQVQRQEWSQQNEFLRHNKELKAVQERYDLESKANQSMVLIAEQNNDRHGLMEYHKFQKMIDVRYKAAMLGSSPFSASTMQAQTEENDKYKRAQAEYVIQDMKDRGEPQAVQDAYVEQFVVGGQYLGSQKGMRPLSIPEQTNLGLKMSLDSEFNTSFDDSADGQEGEVGTFNDAEIARSQAFGQVALKHYKELMDLPNMSHPDRVSRAVELTRESTSGGKMKLSAEDGDRAKLYFRAAGDKIGTFVTTETFRSETASKMSHLEGMNEATSQINQDFNNALNLSERSLASLTSKTEGGREAMALKAAQGTIQRDNGDLFFTTINKKMKENDPNTNFGKVPDEELYPMFVRRFLDTLADKYALSDDASEAHKMRVLSTLEGLEEKFDSNSLPQEVQFVLDQTYTKWKAGMVGISEEEVSARNDAHSTGRTSFQVDGKTYLAKGDLGNPNRLAQTRDFANAFGANIDVKNVLETFNDSAIRDFIVPAMLTEEGGRETVLNVNNIGFYNTLNTIGDAIMSGGGMVGRRIGENGETIFVREGAFKADAFASINNQSGYEAIDKIQHNVGIMFNAESIIRISEGTGEKSGVTREDVVGALFAKNGDEFFKNYAEELGMQLFDGKVLPPTTLALLRSGLPFMESVKRAMLDSGNPLNTEAVLISALAQTHKEYQISIDSIVHPTVSEVFPDQVKREGGRISNIPVTATLYARDAMEEFGIDLASGQINGMGDADSLTKFSEALEIKIGTLEYAHTQVTERVDQWTRAGMDNEHVRTVAGLEKSAELLRKLNHIIDPFVVFSSDTSILFSGTKGKRIMEERNARLLSERKEFLSAYNDLLSFADEEAENKKEEI